MASEISYVGIVCREPYGKHGLVVSQRGDYAVLIEDGAHFVVELSDIIPDWEATMKWLTTWWDKKSAATNANRVMELSAQHYCKQDLSQWYAEIQEAAKVS